MRCHRRQHSGMVLCMLWGTVSCGNEGADIGGPSTQVRRVTVSPPEARASVGGTLNYTATAYDPSGREVTNGVTYVWSSGHPGVATVDRSSGLARGVANGTAMIRVNAFDDRGSAQAEAVLRVEEIADVLVNPTSATVHVGEQTQFVARAYSADGDAAARVPFRWRSSSGEIAAVIDPENGSTQVRGVSPGAATIVVNAVPEGRLGQGAAATVTVLNAP